MTSFVKYAQSYARRRRFTIGLVAVFLLALPVLLYFAWSLYTEGVGQVSIAVIGNGKLQPLQNVEINVRRTGRRSDTIGLTLGVATTISRETFIIVSMPEAYRYTGIETIAGAWRHHTFDPGGDITWHYFKPIVPTPTRRLGIDFEGPLFSGGATLNANIFISTVFNGAEIDLPTKLTVGGLHDFVLDDVTPEPDERQTGYVRYVASSWRERTTDQSVNLRGVDRAASSRAQYLLFVVATLIGVAISVVAAGLQAFVTEYEDSHIDCGRT